MNEINENADIPHSEFLFYRTEDGSSKIEVMLAGDTVWLPQKLIAELYQTTPQNVTLHIKQIYKDEESEESATCKEYLQVQKEGSWQIKRSLRKDSRQTVTKPLIKPSDENNPRGRAQ